MVKNSEKEEKRLKMNIELIVESKKEEKEG